MQSTNWFSAPITCLPLRMCIECTPSWKDWSLNAQITKLVIIVQVVQSQFKTMSHFFACNVCMYATRSPLRVMTLLLIPSPMMTPPRWEGCLLNLLLWFGMGQLHLPPSRPLFLLEKMLMECGCLPESRQHRDEHHPQSLALYLRAFPWTSTQTKHQCSHPVLPQPSTPYLHASTYVCL